MMKKLTASLLLVCMLAAFLCACSSGSAPAETTAPETTAVSETTSAAQTESVPETTESPSPAAALADGVYTVDFNTDSGMFHVNEACEGKGTLTVQNGQMTVHVSLVSKSIVNLYVGTAEDAQKDGAVWLQPTEDPITYKDGYSETVYGFDIPVEALDVDFALAIIGKKNTWYDHTVSVSNPAPLS